MNASERERVRQRANNCCEYCRLPQSALPAVTFHVEHVRSRRLGGNSSFENLALACNRCNFNKGTNASAFDPQTGLLTRLFDPRIDMWSTHFRNVDCEIEGLTDVGRASAVLLKMNDPRRVQLRQAITDELA